MNYLFGFPTLSEWQDQDSNPGFSHSQPDLSPSSMQTGILDSVVESESWKIIKHLALSVREIRSLERKIPVDMMK